MERPFSSQLDNSSSALGYFNIIFPSDSKSSPSCGSDTIIYAPAFPTTSTSDEDHHHQQQIIIQNRKQRRMLSNRESARRSRLRKQQHLDELRAQMAQLRAQNSQILSNFSLASKKYSDLTEENRMLHSEALNLRSHLQKLHDALNYHFDELKCMVEPAKAATTSDLQRFAPNF